jgi:hypothetical protein
MLAILRGYLALAVAVDGALYLFAESMPGSIKCC